MFSLCEGQPSYQALISCSKTSLFFASPWMRDYFKQFACVKLRCNYLLTSFVVIRGEICPKVATEIAVRGRLQQCPTERKPQMKCLSQHTQSIEGSEGLWTLSDHCTYHTFMIFSRRKLFLLKRKVLFCMKYFNLEVPLQNSIVSTNQFSFICSIEEI